MIELKISGMSCQNCVKHAKEAILAVPGVASAEVDLETGLAKIEGTPEIKALIEAIEEEGYSAAE